MDSPELQQSHSIEFLLSLPPYFLLGNFFVLDMVPVSWESVNLLGRVPSHVLGQSVPLQLGPWALGKVVAANPPLWCHSKVYSLPGVSTPWIFSPFFQGRGLPGSGCSHGQLTLSILATRLNL